MENNGYHIQNQSDICKILSVLSNSKVSIEHCREFDLYIARTGVFITPQKNPAKKYFIGGFSCKTNKQYAIQVARYETAERVLATYEMSHTEMREHGYDGYALNEENPSDFVSPKELLIYLGDKSAPKNDAVGLSFHSDLKLAVSHAVSEYLERWILGKIWYEGIPIICLQRKKLGKKYIAEQYTLFSKYLIPFVMTIVFDEEMTALTLGASLSQNFSIALSKSLAEACMLLHDIIANKNYGMLSNEHSLIRMRSQQDKTLSKARYTYIQSILRESQDLKINDLNYHLNDIIDGLGLQQNSVKYCILHQSNYYFLVRAYSQQLLSLKQYRKIYNRTKSYLLDPVC